MNREMPLGRTLKDFDPPRHGEIKLLIACKNGEMADLRSNTPDRPSDEVRVRAGFVRFLLLGGDEFNPVHEKGVWLHGATIEGELDITGCRIAGNVCLTECIFDSSFKAFDARLDGLLNLSGSHLSHGLEADRLICSAGIFLRGSFKSTGEIKLSGAQIGGNLDFMGATLNGNNSAALNADGAKIHGEVNLSNGFSATGEVRLLATQITGDLNCKGGKFSATEAYALSADRMIVNGGVFLGKNMEASGTIRLLGAKITGHLDCSNIRFDSKPNSYLSLDSSIVSGIFFLSSSLTPVRVDASNLRASVLMDDIESWATGSSLDGFQFSSFGGDAPTNGKARIEWLLKQRNEDLGQTEQATDFRPQPWRHLQRVLREMGHFEDAKQVGIAYEDHLRLIKRLGISPNGTNKAIASVKLIVTRATHFAFGMLVGYGYRPLRLMTWIVSIWFICGSAYWWLALPPRSAMAPSDPLIFQNTKYSECLPNNTVNPGNWFLCAPLPGEYSTLSPFAYSLDVMLPVVDLGQEKYWSAYIPTPKNNLIDELFIHWDWGHAVRLLTWFQILFGWVSSLLIVAVISGFSRRNEEG